MNTIVVCGASNVRTVVVENAKHLTSNPLPTFHTLFRNGLTQLQGQEHMAIHKALVCAVNSSMLQVATPRIHDMIRSRIAEWTEAGEVQGVNECERLNLDIGWEVVGGFRLDRHDSIRMREDFETFSDGVFSLPVNVWPFSFRRAIHARARLIELMKQRRNMHAEYPTYLDVISDVNNNNNNVETKSDDVTYECAFELLFGMMTTSSALASAITFLHKRHDVIEQVRREGERWAESGEYFRSDRELAARLPVTSAVVREVLRLRAPVAGGIRKATSDIHIEASYRYE